MEYPKITSAMLVLTHACNLRCRYCFVHHEPQTMTLQIAKDAVNFLVANCAHNIIPGINYFGGEPMLCWESIIVPLTQYIREELKIPFEISMTTNGTLLTQDRIEFLKNNNINILFSIDGNQRTQDYNRPHADGSGSFLDIYNFIPIIASEFHSTFRMTTIPETCNYLFENISFAEQNGFSGFFVVPNIFQDWSESDWDILCEEMRKYSNYFINKYQNNEEPIRFSEFDKSLYKISQINKAIDQHLYRHQCEACKKCGLGANRFASIHPNGDVYACLEMTSNVEPSNPFCIGNIYTGIIDDRRKSLMDLLDKHRLNGLNCESCRLSRICDGGCVANNYLITGDINCVPNIYCKWQQLLLDEAIYVMNALAMNSKFIKEWRERYAR